MLIEDPKVIQFATVRQLEFIDAVKQHGSMRAAAKALGVHHDRVRESLKGLLKRAQLKNYSPTHGMAFPLSDVEQLKGRSIYIKDGQIKHQWVKTERDAESRKESIRAAIEAMREEIPRLAPVASPVRTRSDLCNVYTITDAHVGALAWHKEGGADWDLKIAEATLTGCFSEMVRQSPEASVGFVAQLGDYLDFDGILPVTPTHGNILDVDGRFAKVVKVAIRILRTVIDLALAKHDRVVVLLAEGNHDVTSSIWLRAMFSALYENEPRVEVLESELPYYVYQHGETMLGWHHGHLKKPEALPLTFASQFAKTWGDTTKRYIHVGHRHNEQVIEHSGVKVIQHSTLTARNAYAARGGWLSERQAVAYTYHLKHGCVGSAVVTPEMMEAA